MTRESSISKINLTDDELFLVQLALKQRFTNCCEQLNRIDDITKNGGSSEAFERAKNHWNEQAEAALSLLDKLSGGSTT